MYLLCFTTFLSFLSAHTSVITKPLLKWINRPTEKERELIQEISSLQNEQSRISMVDNFASHAKLQRKINKLKMELLNISKNSTAQKYTSQIAITVTLKILLGFLMLYIAISYRHTPIYVFPSNFGLFPVNKLISYPNSAPGSVSVHMWLMVSNCVARQITK